jgi:hypothetical protein
LLYEMISFVLLHELAHITLGHVLYKDETFGVAHIVEVADVASLGIVEEATVVNRVFEYDADLNALRHLFSLKAPLFRRALLDESTVIRISGLAAVLVLALFVDEWQRSVHWHSRTDEAHPEPLKRVYALKRWLDTLQEFGGLRESGHIEQLKYDVGSMSASLNMVVLTGAIVGATKGSVADLSWSEDFEREYALAAHHTKRALARGFGVRQR